MSSSKSFSPSLLSMSIALFAIFAGGCSFKPNAKGLAEADFGIQPTQTAAEQAADAWLVTALKDPESRRVRYAPLAKAWVFGGYKSFGGGGHVYGYALPAFVNAKNGFGGYTGEQLYVFWFKDGELKSRLPDKREYAEDTWGFVE